MEKIMAHDSWFGPRNTNNITEQETAQTLADEYRQRFGSNAAAKLWNRIARFLESDADASDLDLLEEALQIVE